MLSHFFFFFDSLDCMVAIETKIIQSMHKTEFARDQKEELDCKVKCRLLFVKILSVTRIQFSINMYVSMTRDDMH